MTDDNDDDDVTIAGAILSILYHFHEELKTNRFISWIILRHECNCFDLTWRLPLSGIATYVKHIYVIGRLAIIRRLREARQGSRTGTAEQAQQEGGQKKSF